MSIKVFNELRELDNYDRKKYIKQISPVDLDSLKAIMGLNTNKAILASFEIMDSIDIHHKRSKQ